MAAISGDCPPNRQSARTMTAGTRLFVPCCVSLVPRTEVFIQLMYLRDKRKNESQKLKERSEEQKENPEEMGPRSQGEKQGKKDKTENSMLFFFFLTLESFKDKFEKLQVQEFPLQLSSYQHD